MIAETQRLRSWYGSVKISVTDNPLLNLPFEQQENYSHSVDPEEGGQ